LEGPLLVPQPALVSIATAQPALKIATTDLGDVPADAHVHTTHIRFAERSQAEAS